MNALAGSKKNGVAETVRSFVLPCAEELGLSVWDVRYVREGGAWYLRILIDKPGGVGIEDCEKMSRAINGPLDELDPIPGSYCLEVSSPGINRELTRPEHFEAYAGKDVTVRFIRPLPDGRRVLTGKLGAFSGAEFTLVPETGEPVTISRKETASVRLREDDFLEETEES
ncbi:MAG TPA: ribosome maturation factor RimP [Armatimonadota bacterium]|nr:ribosome maturation factor RimP [Armatimonadota bacterium]